MKKTILFFTLLTLISTAFAAGTNETPKNERLEEMMRIYQGE
jgi:hypothetical protein